MSKKNLLYEFDPVIYPRKLWVCIGVDEEYINGKFHGEGGVKLNFGNSSNYYALTLTI